MKHILESLAILAVSSALTIAGETKSDTSEKSAKWTNLLVGDDINQLWQPTSNRAGKRTKEIGARWSLKDGVMTLKKDGEGRGGSIETKETFFDFELKFEFNIHENCNSGIKYRQANSTGFEYQIIDDVNYRDNSVSHRTAELYELKEEESPRKLNPAGEWNSGRIVAKGNTLEHWLNGQKVLTIEIGSEDWKKRFEDSKYFKSEILDFGTHTGGIHIQDHSDTEITFKNMMIRKL
ncbi:3-keto-disaccharide hydrolase [Rubritalea sp.]|uniref:3-keto-disaccharide hydrolase n=1 Tax=Rubritalea sp. TaxID=2109375 RepID=UPI003EF17BCD